MISFIPPMMTVLEDKTVTTSEINWIIQESMMIVIMAVVMTGFWKMADRMSEEVVR